MTQHIDEIVEELCRIDPAFFEQKTLVRAVVAKLIAVKPDTKFDEAFARRLGAELKNKVAARNVPVGLNLNFMKKFNFAFGFALLALALGAGAYYYANSGEVPGFSARDTSFGGQAEITKLASKAFGSLAFAQNPVRSQSGGGGAAMLEGDSFTDQSAVFPAPAGLGGGGAGGGGMGIMPPYYGYKFVYKGDALELTDETVQVLRRQLGESSSRDLKNFLLANDFGLADFGSFSNLKLQSFNFTEDRDHGYSVMVNFADGSIAINEDWLRWPDAHLNCADQPCYDAGKIEIGEIPSDKDLIAIADDFLSRHGIATGDFGQPSVENFWRMQYEQSSSQTDFYPPETISVIYPLRILGQEVFDEAGNPFGMTISVNTRVRQVTGLWNLTTQRYQSSDYAAETDAGKIIKIAEAGGFRRNYPLEDSAGAKTLSLGTPDISLVKIYSWQDGVNQELLVPALVFPVVDAPGSADYYSPKNVVVPLAKELLDESVFIGPHPF